MAAKRSSPPPEPVINDECGSISGRSCLPFGEPDSDVEDVTCQLENVVVLRARKKVRFTPIGAAVEQTGRAGKRVYTKHVLAKRSPRKTKKEHAEL